jgi:hypothetical protein
MVVSARGSGVSMLSRASRTYIFAQTASSTIVYLETDVLKWTSSISSRNSAIQQSFVLASSEGCCRGDSRDWAIETQYGRLVNSTL